MTLNQKVTGRAASIPAGLAIAGVISMLVTMLVVVLGGVLVSSEIIAYEHIGYCSMMALLVGSAVAAITAVNRIKHQKMLVCILSGVVYYMILLSVTALFFGGQYRGMGVTLLMVMGGCALGAIISNREKGRGMKRMRRKTHW